MRPVVTAEQMRAAEQAVFDAHPGIDLMGAAAAAVAAEARRAWCSGPILVVAGPGNNGGDGLFAAAELAKDHDVRVWLALDAAHEAGLRAAREAGCRVVAAPEAMALLADAGLVIDAVLGIGGRPGLSGPLETFAQACRDVEVPVLAVDLPSGLDTDSGLADSSFHATTTVTFAALKPCHVLAPAAERCGRVVVADIDVPIRQAAWSQAEAADVARAWPVPDSSDHKYTRGVVGLDVGSEQYPGAALLACAKALHTGPGMVRYLGRAPAEMIVQRFPSVVTAAGRVQAMVVGSGWGDVEAEDRFREAAGRGVPLVVDADALRWVQHGLPEGSLLTPHAGELARLLDVDRSEVEAEPRHHAALAAERFGATVLLKGAVQFVAEPGGRVVTAVRGPAWTGQAGSGDVLAGACGTLLAAGLTALDAAVAAASLQAMTAEAHPGPWPPDRLAEWFPEVIAGLAASTPRFDG